MPTALIQINDGSSLAALIGARPRLATGRPRPRSEAAVEGQADPASDVSRTPRPVGLVGRLVAKHYHVKQHTWRASSHLGIAKSLRWFAELPIGGVLSRTGTRARHRHSRDRYSRRPLTIFPAWSNSKDTSVKRSRLRFGCARITSSIWGSVNLILVVGFIATQTGCCSC